MNKKNYKCYGVSAIFLITFLLGGNVIRFQPMQEELITQQIFEKPGTALTDKFFGVSETAQTNESQMSENQPYFHNLAFDSKETAVGFANECIKDLFGTSTENLQPWVNYNDGNSASIQPQGWFIRFSDSKWEYAVWIYSNPNEIKVSRSIPQHLRAEIPDTKNNVLQKDEDYLKKSDDILKNTFGERRTVINTEYVVDTNANKPNTANVKILLEDGASYTLSFYIFNGELKEFIYAV
mgnify:CR=1 FL=1